MVNQKYFKTSLSPNKVLIRSFTEIIEFDNVKFHKVYHLKMVFKENFLRSFTEIIEFDNVKFHKVYHLKMVFKENFLRLAVTVIFQKISTSNCEFS